MASRPDLAGQIGGERPSLVDLLGGIIADEPSRSCATTALNPGKPMSATRREQVKELPQCSYKPSARQSGDTAQPSLFNYVLRFDDDALD